MYIAERVGDSTEKAFSELCTPAREPWHRLEA